MLRPLIVRAILLSAALASTPAFAEETPSTLMPKVVGAKVPPGYVRMWTLTIECESSEQSMIAQCGKILSDNGFSALSSLTTGTNLPSPLLRVTGKKDYAGPSEKADVVLDDVKKKIAGGSVKLTWGISENLVPAR